MQEINLSLVNGFAISVYAPLFATQSDMDAAKVGRTSPTVLPEPEGNRDQMDIA